MVLSQSPIQWLLEARFSGASSRLETIQKVLGGRIFLGFYCRLETILRVLGDLLLRFLHRTARKIG